MADGASHHHDPPRHDRVVVKRRSRGLRKLRALGRGALSPGRWNSSLVCAPFHDTPERQHDRDERRWTLLRRPHRCTEAPGTRVQRSSFAAGTSRWPWPDPVVHRAPRVADNRAHWATSTSACRTPISRSLLFKMQPPAPRASFWTQEWLAKRTCSKRGKLFPRTSSPLR